MLIYLVFEISQELGDVEPKQAPIIQIVECVSSFVYSL